MRRIVTISILILLGFFPSHGQIYIGLRSGYNMSGVTFVPSQNQRLYYRMAGDYGITFRHYDNKYVGFEAELNYIVQGYRLPVREWEIYRRENTYIKLPIFMQGKLAFKNTYIHVNAGCYGAYLIKARGGINTTGLTIMEDIDLNALYDIRFDFGLVGGIGFGHEFKWGTLQAEARIFYGLRDLFDYQYPDMPKQSRATVENVSLSYYLNLSDLLQRINEKKRFMQQAENTGQ